MCDCLNSDKLSPEVSEAVQNANPKIDTFVKGMLSELIERAKARRDEQFNARKAVKFPAPYNNSSSMVDIHCGTVSHTQKHIYQIPRVDEYYGDFGLLDDWCFFGKYSDGMFGSSERLDSNKLDWDAIAREPTQEAGRYFTGVIGKPLYNIDDISNLQRESQGRVPTAASGSFLQNKQLNDWKEVDLDELKGDHQILSALKGDEDAWIMLIAFGGYGAHITQPFKDKKHPKAFFASDVRFLATYNVRPGYVSYGAMAYFDNVYHVQHIFVSHNNTMYSKEESSAREWEHAKWVWKVSVAVAVFVVDNLCHCRLREANGLVSAMYKHLGANHPIRRLMLPFTLGTVKSNRVMNEYMRKNGLFHRCMAFEYAELQRLIADSLQDAPKQAPRGVENRMRYRFRLLKKKVATLKKLPDQIYPLYTDLFAFWVQTIKYVEAYVQLYYPGDPEDTSGLMNDGELSDFYDAISTSLDIDKDKFRLKKFNLVNMLTHYITNSTAWANHLNTATSFEYSMDQDWTGVKIVGNMSKQNNINDYAQYCLLCLSLGWRQPNMKALADDGKTSWDVVLLDDDKKPRTLDALRRYFEQNLDTITQSIHQKQRIAPFHAIDPNMMQSSIRM